MYSVYGWGVCGGECRWGDCGWGKVGKVIPQALRLRKP